jgi:putative transcriptional regulator
MSQTELQLRTGLAYSTINDLANKKPRRIELATLEVLCRVLECQIEDILEYTAPDAKRARSREPG